MGSKSLPDVVDGSSSSHDQVPAAVDLLAATGREPDQRIGPPVTFAASQRFGANGTRLLVQAVGEIDLVTAPALANALQLGPSDQRPPQDVTEIVVDLRTVTFLSAAGLGVLVLAYQRCRRDGVTIRIVADQRAVTIPVRLTGLDRTLGLRQDLEW